MSDLEEWWREPVPVDNIIAEEIIDEETWMDGFVRRCYLWRELASEIYRKLGSVNFDLRGKRGSGATTILGSFRDLC